MGAIRKAAVDTLGLVGDGDDQDLIQAIEKSFDVRFGEATTTWATVGDIHQAIVERLEPSAAPGRCATAMAFYDLRRALAPLWSSTARITPGARLSDSIRQRPREVFKALQRDLGVLAPPIQLSGVGALGMLMILGGFLAVVIAFAQSVLWPVLWPIVLLLPLGCVLVRLDPGSYGAMTVGDLARDIANQNFAHYAAKGADGRPDAVWRTLCALIKEETGRRADIRPQTQFY